MKTLCIDLGVINFGLAIFNNKKIIKSEHFKISKKQNIQKTLFYFHNKLSLLNNENNIELIIYEKPCIHGSANITNKLSCVEGILLFFCEDKRIPCICYYPTAVKKSLTGNGKANKQAIKDSLKGSKILDLSWIDLDKISDHESDSIGLFVKYLKDNDGQEN